MTVSRNLGVEEHDRLDQKDPSPHRILANCSTDERTNKATKSLRCGQLGSLYRISFFRYHLIRYDQGQRETPRTPDSLKDSKNNAARK